MTFEMDAQEQDAAVTETNGKFKPMVLELTTSVIERTIQSVISCLSSFLTVILMFTVSIFLYGTFYYAYIPASEHEIGLDLQFQPCNDSQLRCSFPSGVLQLGRSIRLVEGQSYNVMARLTLPYCKLNEDHGDFMTCLTLSKEDGVKIDQSCKSSRLEYRSPLQKMIETVVYAPFLLAGISNQKQEIRINFFQKFQLDPRLPGKMFTLEILSRHLDISRASIGIHVEMKGLRYVMFYHPWISAVLGVGINLFFIGSIITMSLTSRSATAQQSSLSESGTVEEIRGSGEVVNQETAMTVDKNICGKLSNLVITIVLSTAQLLLLSTVMLTSYQAYQHQIYNPSEIAEITYNEVRATLDNQETFKYYTEFLHDLTEDIMVKLLIVKVTFIFLIVILMSMAKYVV